MSRSALDRIVLARVLHIGASTCRSLAWIGLALLRDKYRELFANDPEYDYIAAHTTPDAHAAKIVPALARGTANKDGKAVKAVCKALKISHTYRDIREFLGGEAAP